MLTVDSKRKKTPISIDNCISVYYALMICSRETCFLYLATKLFLKVSIFKAS